MALLSIRNVSLGFSGSLLFDEINLQIEQGERVCLVGRNGEGKTTLLNIINDGITPDKGEIYRRPDLRTACLAQEIPSGLTGSVFDIVAESLKADHNRQPEGQSSPGSSETEEAEWQTSLQVNMVLTQLKLNPDIDFETLSAGLKRRVLLARALAVSPDILLLDEPTNHMDIEAIGLTEEFLLKFKGTVIFVTHDRVFLQKIATRIAEIDRGKITSWPYDFETYLRRKAELIETETDQNIQFDKKLAKEEAWLRKGLRARRTRNEGRVRALMQMREERQKRRNLAGNTKMQLQEAERSGKLVIEAKGTSFCYDDNNIIQNFSITVMRGDRIGVIGPNGSGKTTLLRLLLKECSPATGSVRHGTNLETIYFDQTREQLDEEKSVQDNVADGKEIITVNGKNRHVLNYLKDFLFFPDRARSPVKTLSGGERNRLLLARLFTKQANMLVMDEPTNDLDMQTLELLEELLLEYNGTILLVSHDRAFLNNVVTSTLVFEGKGRVKEYIGGYDDWMRQRKKEGPPPQKQVKKSQRRDKPITDEKKRKLSYKEQRELEALPEQIEMMEKEQEELFSSMADPEFYKRSGEEIAAARARQQELEERLKKAYDRWDELESRNI